MKIVTQTFLYLFIEPQPRADRALNIKSRLDKWPKPCELHSSAGCNFAVAEMPSRRREKQ
jgi:hypothetical protein